jgi:hypothetical protein
MSTDNPLRKYPTIKQTPYSKKKEEKFTLYYTPPKAHQKEEASHIPLEQTHVTLPLE